LRLLKRRRTLGAADVVFVLRQGVAHDLRNTGSDVG
jgi:hypothetical protein